MEAYNHAIKVAFGVCAVAVALEEELSTQRKRRPGKCLQGRRSKGRHSTDFTNMTQTPSIFYENFHMTDTEFNSLFGRVEPYLIWMHNDDIPPKAKLAIVLEYLASGDLQRHVGYTYRISEEHLGSIIEKVCSAICTVLKGEFPKWTTDNLLDWAEQFENRWNFPNCVGAVDGKHLAVKAPHNSRSTFYNYKGFSSIVLMAVCDAFNRFTYIDVGCSGSEGDLNAFSRSTLGEALLSDELPFPEDSLINGQRTPYFIVGNDAFPLHKRVMKPYFGRYLQKEERIFNYRLSRARRCIENTFGILCSRWMAVQRTIMIPPERAQKIVSACCSLHNFLMRVCPQEYNISQDSITIPPETVFTDLRPCRRGRSPDYCKEIRNNLRDYLNSKAGYSQVRYQAESAGIST